jgi:uncharacterized protein YcaQ
MKSALRSLRARAVASVFSPRAALETAVQRLGFVQADPIRVPATAQDLILRHRAAGYRAGDLDRGYASSGIEEEYLYAYGFLPRATRSLLHPRPSRPLSRVEQRVLAVVRERGEVHPRELEARRVVNAWGGTSKATTLALDALHYRGMLRVVRREAGTRVYAVAAPMERQPDGERLRGLILLLAQILAPTSERTLRRITARYRSLGEPRKIIDRLVSEGALHASTFDGTRYLDPAGGSGEDGAPEEVRFLAPFDPVVWDRSRFEHLWGWQYRFEAYTPVAKRVRGYYAMPLLWRDQVIGWANADEADVRVGFVGARPRDPAFRRELDAEIERLRAFLRTA